MRVAAIVKQYNGCSFYRILLPLEYMPWSKEDQVKLFYPEGAVIRDEDRHLAGTVSEIKSYQPDIIFLNGSLNTNGLEWLQECKASGIKIVVDIDDYWELHGTHPIYETWYKQKHNLKVLEIMKLADVVFTATENLFEKIRLINKNCIYIPNAVPYGTKYYKKEDNQKFLSKMNFLYAGGSTHYPDVLLLKNTFDRLGADKWTKEKAIFTLAGFNPLKGNLHCQWDRMASIFKRTNSYQILETRPLQEHMTFYDQADVSLVPLDSNEFNRCKSILRVIESSTRELPCIVSNVQPYSDLKGMPLMWDNWKDNIKYCLKNPEAVKDQGKALAEQMKLKYNLPIWAESRYQIFSHLMNK